MIKEIILLLVIALASASAQWWRGFHHHNHENGPVGRGYDVFNYPWNGWKNHPGMDRRPGKNYNGHWHKDWSNWPQKKNNKPNPDRTTSTLTTPPSTASTLTTRTTPFITTGYVSTTTASPAFVACSHLCRIEFHDEPVCGTDGMSYYNSQHLACAVRCGRNVSKAHDGRC